MSAPPVRPSRLARPAEWAGIAGLAALAVWCVARSWRKWPDPLIDFGRELYLPWRIAHGAVLYRDADDFYGPLSQYVNAGLFHVFGPGLIVLVAANLAIFAAIAALLYALFRRAWGPGAAIAALAVFIGVFGFSQYVNGGCYTYAAPYAHEATHGLFVCLLLVWALLGWLERPSCWRSAAVGLCFGLTLVLKAEFILAAGLVLIAALWLNRRSAAVMPASAGMCLAAAAVLPSAVFLALFRCSMDWADAWSGAARAWWAVVGSRRFVSDPVQLGFLGLDQPWAHLREHALATAEAAGLIALMAGAAWAIGRLSHRIARAAALVVFAGAALDAGAFAIHWIFVGKCLLGLALLYLASRVRPSADRNAARTLLAVLAAALLARMALNGRIYQFGFCQAALAAMLVTAVLMGEIPSLLRARGGLACALPIAAAALLAPGVAYLMERSGAAWRLRTHPVAEGRDRFWSLPPSVDPTGELVNLVSARLRRTDPSDTVLVLPEGEMINYLARRPSPLAPFFYFSAVTSGGAEDAIVDQLQRRPPDWVVIISRDLREYGIQRYGESPGHGQEIMRWVDAHYLFQGAAGGDPLDVHQRGAVLLRRAP